MNTYIASLASGGGNLFCGYMYVHARCIIAQVRVIKMLRNGRYSGVVD